MEEAGDLGVPFMEPDHDGEEWEEWVDWSAPAVAGRVTSGGGQAAGAGPGPGARAGDVHVPLDTAVYSNGTGGLRRAFGS